VCGLVLIRTTLLKQKKEEISIFYSGLPSLFCRVRYAHTTKQTPRQKMATPLFGFAHPPPNKNI